MFFSRHSHESGAIRLSTYIFALLAGAVLMLGFLSWYFFQREGEKAAYEEARNFFSLSNRTVELGIQNNFAPLITSLHMQAKTLPALSVGDVPAAEKLLLKPFTDMLRFHPSIRTAVYVSEDGSFLGVAVISSDAEREELGAPPETVFFVRALKPGSSTMVLRFFDINLKLCGETSRPVEYDPRTLNWYLEAARAGKPMSALADEATMEQMTLTEPYVFTSSKELGIACSMPLEQGRAVVSYHIRLRSLTSMLRSLEVPPAMQILLYDIDHRYIASRQQIMENGAEILGDLPENKPKNLAVLQEALILHPAAAPTPNSSPNARHDASHTPELEASPAHLPAHWEDHPEDAELALIGSDSWLRDPRFALLTTLHRQFHDKGYPRDEPVRITAYGKAYFVQASTIHLGQTNFVAFAYAPEEGFVPLPKNFLFNTALYTAFTLLFFSVLAYVFSRSVTRPINRLCEEMEDENMWEQPTRGKPIYSPVHEVRSLIKHFTRMKRDLRQTHDALLDVHVNLEYDVQERTRELAHALEKAEAATHAKTQFIAVMSHELRTPLNGVMGMAQLCLDTPLDKKQQHYIERILYSASHLGTLANDLLDISQIESGALNIELNKMDVRALMENIRHSFSPQARQKGLDFGVRVEDSVPAYTGGDPLRISQVLHNLISNALKFTSEGSILIHVEIDTQSAFDPNAPLPERILSEMLRFNVRDTGAGLDTEEQNSLFVPFSHVNTQRMRAHGGTGLGLFIARSLAHSMGGGLLLQSKKGAGSTFSLLIPFIALHEEQMANLQKLAEEAPKALAGRRVLLVEDNEINQEIAIAMLESMGMEAELAENGKIACDMLVYAESVDTPYDIILMDIQMPVMDGLEATCKIREMGIDIPIIGLSANATLGDELLSLEAGMQAHIGKPIRRETLMRAIVEFLKA